MTSKELEKELQAIDPNFTVVENPNRGGLSNIFYEGTNYDLPPVSTDEIREDRDDTHRYVFPNGMSARLWSHKEIIDRANAFLANIDNVKKDHE